MFLYTFFVVNVTTMLFVTCVYAFAFRFLRERLYLGISLSWFINTIYLLLESPRAFTDLRESSQISLGALQTNLITLALGILPSLVFHLSAKLTSGRDSFGKALARPVLIVSIPYAVIAFGILTEEAIVKTLGLGMGFALLASPGSIYSSFVTLLIAIRFSYAFPEEEFGYASRLLSGSWAAYGLLQLTYPLRLFENLGTFIGIMFACAMVLKLLGIIGLLAVLRKSYEFAQEQARHASVLSDLGNVAAGLHHDIATPLASLDTGIEILRSKRADDPVVATFLGNIALPMQAIDAALQVVDLARMDLSSADYQIHTASARDIINRAMNLFRGQFTNSTLQVFVPGDKTFYVQAHAEMLAQAFVNIVKNAHEAGAHSLVIAMGRSAEAPGKVRFTFTNDGDSLTSEELANCLRPGWSTKRQRVGRANVGMGLYMASRYIAIHRGEMEITNRNDKPGVCVNIDIPAARARSRAAIGREVSSDATNQ